MALRNFGALIEEVRFARDSLLEETVSSELVSSLLIKENTGNFIDSDPAKPDPWAKIAIVFSGLFSKFPTQQNRELIGPVSGNYIAVSGKPSARSRKGCRFFTFREQGAPARHLQTLSRTD